MNISNNNDNSDSDENYAKFKEAALIHKVARSRARSLLYSGGKISDLVDKVEEIIIKLCKYPSSEEYFGKGGSRGIAFPVGVSINNCAAHDSKIVGDRRVFRKGDVVKIDIGVHIEGRIIDSAFTHIVTDVAGVHDRENVYNNVLEASRESMFSAIKMAGPDQRLVELSENISEIIKSYEIDGKKIVPIGAIGGHNIKKYQIHAGKLILCEPDHEVQRDMRMEEGEIYAVETFASTGKGTIYQDDVFAKCSHFMEANELEVGVGGRCTKKDKKFFKQTDLYGWLKTRNGLPFSNTWIRNVSKLEKGYKLGIPSGQIMMYPPLYDVEGSVVAQFEHTIHVGKSVEIFSLGDDY